MMDCRHFFLVPPFDSGKKKLVPPFEQEKNSGPPFDTMKKILIAHPFSVKYMNTPNTPPHEKNLNQ